MMSSWTDLILKLLHYTTSCNDLLTVHESGDQRIC